MSQTNQVILEGNLTAEPETQQTQSGQTLTKFRLANNQSRKNGDTWESVPHYFSVTTWGHTAERAATLTKGSGVVVVGRLNFEQWQDKDGNNRNTVTVTANTVSATQRIETPEAVGVSSSSNGTSGLPF